MNIVTFALTTVLLAQTAQPAPSSTFPFDPTVAVILRNETVILTRSEAEAWYKVVDPIRDQSLHVALTLALGTVPEQRVHEPGLTTQERERFRWHRRPLQGN